MSPVRAGAGSASGGRTVFATEPEKGAGKCRGTGGTAVNREANRPKARGSALVINAK
mgnify:CR=1 FL=1